MVEDEALTALSLQDALEDGGFDVHHALDDQEAFAFLQDHRGELAGLITDIRIGPGLTGWEVAKRARELDPRIPVIYVSGDSAHEHARRGASQSVMLQKPFPPNLLLETLRQLLASSEASNG
jgi:CheY-like chemotaxis protein